MQKVVSSSFLASINKKMPILTIFKREKKMKYMLISQLKKYNEVYIFYFFLMKLKLNYANDYNEVYDQHKHLIVV